MSLEVDGKQQDVILIDQSSPVKAKKKNATTPASSLTPPRKKLKQEAIYFPKLTKEEYINKEVTNKENKNNGNGNSENENKNSKTKENSSENINKRSIENEGQDLTNSGSNTPITSPKTPKAATKVLSKKSPFTKEERIRLKEEKEATRKKREEELEVKRAKKEEERLLKLAEKEKKEQERKEKEKLKEEDKRKKEEEKRKKDEQKEAEKKQREEERKRKEESVRLEKEKKDAERKKKEDERIAEEEKKKAEEDADRKKKEKAAQQFKSFFKKKTPKKVVKEEIKCGIWFAMPYQLKPGQQLAPLVRRNNFEKSLVDRCMEEQEMKDSETYLTEFKRSGKTLLSRRGHREQLKLETRNRKLEKEAAEKTKANNEKPASQATDNPDVLITPIVLEDDSDSEDEVSEASSFCKETLTSAKYLQFEENTRPAYYGTWRKKSKRINGRKPFTMDEDVFDYEVESDEEWIDEPGEDLDEKLDGEDNEEEETEDDKDGFFVPHGYLSDDEGVNDNHSDNEQLEDADDQATTMQNNLENDKLKKKVMALEAGFKKQMHQCKPVCIGIIYPTNGDEVVPSFKKYAKVIFKPINKEQVVNDEKDENQINVPRSLPDEAMPIFVRYLHGNTSGREKMVVEFKNFWRTYAEQRKLDVRREISKRQLSAKIQAISTRAPNADLGKPCYLVNDEILKLYSLDASSLESCLPRLDKVDVENTDQNNAVNVYRPLEMSLDNIISGKVG